MPLRCAIHSVANAASAGLLTFGLTACVSASHAAALPVELVQGRIVQLWNVAAEQTSEGVIVSGLVKRGRTPAGPVNEHLHADILDGEGRVLSTQDVRWNGFLSSRSMHSTRFSAKLTGAIDASARIRVSVVPGSVHNSLR